jgi:phosphate starvation-inducible protein PhoH
MVVTGDLAQADRLKDNGLINFIELLDKHKKLERIDVVHFDNKDIERHEAVKEILEIYGD